MGINLVIYFYSSNLFECCARYMIPKGSMSFCLYDTRSLSDDSSENTEMLKRWMTKGVLHGDPVVRSDFWSKELVGFYDLFIIQSIPVCELLLRDSDRASLRTYMKGKARWNIFLSREVRMVNSVIVVVNGISVLKSMDSNDESDLKYTRTIAAAFSCPYLSFKGIRTSLIPFLWLCLFELHASIFYCGNFLAPVFCYI